MGGGVNRLVKILRLELNKKVIPLLNVERGRVAQFHMMV